MIAWSNTHTSSIWRHFSRRIWFILFVVALITTIFFSLVHNASASDNKVVGFSARLKNSNGGIVPDGQYNAEFKLYSQASGGAPIWTESYYDNNGPSENGDNRLMVTNGYLSAKLGSITPFNSNIDWSGGLWLTMNIGGTTQESDLINIPWDGEMSPRIRLSATPYSMDSGSVGGKKAEELIQLGQGSQTDSSNNSSISINKTGVGDLIHLQSSGVNAFILSQTGDITMGGDSDKSISMGDAQDGIGHNFSISAGNSSTDNSSGGNLILQGGTASGLNSTGGDLIIDGGAGTEGGGSINIGSTNSGTINIGNSNSTTKVDGNLQTDSIDSISQGTLQIGGPNATEVAIGQDTTIEGDVSIKAQQDSTSTFKIQNSSGDNLLNIDSTNNQISIGSDASATTSLVLDKKTSADDPAGSDGAMYYNGHAGKFRCYEDGSWKDCITPLPVSKVVSTETTNSTTTPIDVGDISYDLAPNTKYYYKFLVIHESDNSTTGVGFGITGPSDLAASNWCVNTTATTSSDNPGHWGTYCGVGDASATTQGSDNLGRYFNSTIEGYIETGEETGSLKLRIKSESTNQVTVKSGTFGILQIVQ